MYAVIASGGKQYRVKEGDFVKLESLPNEVGSSIEFTDILMLQDDTATKVGNPHLDGVKVIGEIIDNGRGPKITTIKFRRRKHYMKKIGHRQNYTQVKITKIGV